MQVTHDSCSEYAISHRTQKGKVKDVDSMTHATKILKSFIETTDGDLSTVSKHFEEAKEAYTSAVEYFGENSKTTSPQTFFSTFARFSAAYKQALKVVF